VHEALDEALAPYMSLLDIVQSDNGSEFRNAVLKAFCKKNGLKLVHSSVRKPSTNGLVEQANGQVQRDMAALLADLKGTGWDKRLKTIMGETCSLADCAHCVV
jgi:transposase InsO family protein